MSIGKIQERLKRLSCIVSDAGKFFMTIPAMETGVSFVRINVRTVLISNLRGASALIVKKCLKSTRQARTFVVRWSAEMLGQKPQTGRHPENYCANVSNAVRNFGEQSRVLKSWVASFAQGNVKSILKSLILLRLRAFTGLAFGYRFVKGYFFGMATSASNAVWKVKGFMSTIRNLREMVVEKVTITSSRFALIVTGFYTLADNLRTVLAERVCSLLGDSPFVVFVILG